MESDDTNIFRVLSNKILDFDEYDDQDDFLAMVQSKSHDDIVEYLHEKPLGLVWPGPRNKENHTIFRTILEEGIDGDEIIKKRLDTSVLTTTDDPKSPDYAFRLDMTPLMVVNEDDYDQTALIKDVLDVADSEVC